MEKKHIDYPLSLREIEEDGAFAGYASVFDIIDNHNDIIVKGAFKNSLKSKKIEDIKLLWQHRSDEPIGVFTKIREDEKGLYVEGKLLLDVQRGQEAYTLLKSGAMDGLSIGYSVVDFEIDALTGNRILKELDLWEVSLVTFPANSAANVTSVKSDIPDTIREFEQFLREAGFSRSNAKLIALGGFKSSDHREDEQKNIDPVEVDFAFDKAINILTKG